MIKSVNIKGFKSIVDQKLDLGGATLFCGLNNSGKSSAVQAIRMYCKSSTGAGPLLSGHGFFEDIHSKLVRQSDPIEISCTYDKDDQNDSLTVHRHSYTGAKRSPFVIYLSAERWGPRTALPLEEDFKHFPSLGEHGEYTIGFLDALRSTIVSEQLWHPKAQGMTLEYQVSAWLNEIAPGAAISFEVNRKTDSSIVQYNDFRATNSGFGLSYALPLIAAILGASTKAPTEPWGNNWDKHWDQDRANKGVMLLLENPEAHLHPSAQTSMGRLIALGAAAGLQIVVETQSEHVMDGIRIAVKQGSLSHEKAILHYFSRDDEGRTEIVTPTIAKDGKLSCWPNGFFDQTLKNRMQLAK